ncbi:hypothetical protein PbDSM24746_25530 [Paenibacillus macerans]|nr:hypothetical protein PbDSM24746_25530 [Paenibacillus macerans]GBK68861.1 hypothetical protein PbJCM17693_25690 [Paenibacillus macerans]
MRYDYKWRYLFYLILLLVTITATLKTWNDEGYDKFLSSIGAVACLVGLYKTWKERR